ncbi:MAG: DUF4270 domain-containing protein [Gelidibacter sp.]
MKKIKFALKNIAVLVVLISSFIACDKDFATVGSDIVGQNNFGVGDTLYSVIAYTNPLEPVQTNNLPLNYLGAYKDQLYGLTTASFVSQLSSSSIDPDFGTHVTIDSVVLKIPYFSTRTEINEDNETIYELDSIFGNDITKIELFENTYFLSDIDPNSEFDTPLKYYSNFSNSNSPINPALLEGTPINIDGSEDGLILENFKPSNKEIQLWDEDNEISERLAPALRVKLDTLFWHNKIIAMQGQTELSNVNNFNNYFRGIYIKATPIDGSGSMALLNFGASSANITIYYSKDSTVEEGERVTSTYVLTFGGKRVNFINNQFILPIPQGDPVVGDEKLYLKGAQGSTAVVDLFNSGDFEDGYSPEFMEFKNKFVETDAEGKFVKAKRLVNEANLVFYVDQTTPLENEPERIYLYDLKNNTPLIDYYIDLANTTSPNDSKTNHLGVLERVGDVPTGEGYKYKIKITEHINNLLLRDSTNVKLGLAISGNVNLENDALQYNLLTPEEDVVNKVPVSSILSPRGTVLYGNNTTNEEKKLYLEIYYTDPNN